jgi:D-lactate dehydrogenase (cytochrome)
MHVKTQPEDIQNYLADASNMQGGHAERLFLPTSEMEVADILREANEKRIPVTVSGARTGTVGGAIPFGGWVISLDKMNGLKFISAPLDKRVRVGAGVILGDLQKAVEAKGCLYPPDPTEWSCQIGGTVATNASGARSFKYGATRRYVSRLTVVLATGEIVDIKRGESKTLDGKLTLRTREGREIAVNVPTYERPYLRKNVSGYFNDAALDAIDLFIGSEGTLGVITEVELRLEPKPEGFFSGIVFFRADTDLLEFVDEAKRLAFSNRRGRLSWLWGHPASGPREIDIAPPPTTACFVEIDEEKAGLRGFDPTLLEYFDANALKFISEKFPETPDGMAGAVFFEQETGEKDEEAMLSVWNSMLEKHNADLDRSWFTTNEQDREKMRAFRHALPVSVNEFIARHKQRKVGTDMAVPDEAFPSFLKFYKDTLDASGIDYVIFGHIGDCHLHANLLPRNKDEATRARHIYGRCIAQAIMLGGCVSAEHGIGKLKRKYLAAMMGERYLNEMAAVKRAFDPNGILGRGNMFDETYL